MNDAILKILIIEDHEVVRQGLKLILNNWWQGQLEAVEAVTADDARQLLERYPDFALIILDLKLPDVNGFDLLDEIVESLPAVPVVVLTMEESMSAISKAFEHGAKGYIPKTSPQDVIFNALELVLSGGAYFPSNIIEPSEADPRINASNGNAAYQPGLNYRSLTQRQLEVLSGIAQGKTNKEVAEQLNMSPATVRSYLTIIFRQLNVRNRTEAVHIARRVGLIDD